MGEGVDPKQMCQILVDKVARSEQLLAIADPELEGEALAVLKKYESLDDRTLAEKLGLSRRGATFLLSKLEKKGDPFR